MQKLQVQSTLGYGKNYNLGLNAVAPACRPAIRSDNVRDHPAGMSDQPLQKHTQVRLGVHHIVIGRPSERISSPPFSTAATAISPSVLFV